MFQTLVPNIAGHIDWGSVNRVLGVQWMQTINQDNSFKNYYPVYNIPIAMFITAIKRGLYKLLSIGNQLQIVVDCIYILADPYFNIIVLLFCGSNA